jgi:hypothetical protein
VSLVRSPDVVTIRFVDDRITGFCVIGTASPCNGFLVDGLRVSRAIRCLLANGFIIISSRSNVVVLRRSFIF